MNVAHTADATTFDVAVQDVAGVEAVYAAGSLTARAAGRIRGLADGEAHPSAHVQVRRGGADVTVSIGVDARRDCAEVADRVADVIRSSSSSVPVQRVRVRVSRLVAER